jgi:hypothetical protein
VLFRITRDSSFRPPRPGSARRTCSGRCEALRDAVPANVRAQIRSWSGAAGESPSARPPPPRPDAATAARVLATVGAGRLEPLSETVLALVDPTKKAEVVRQCRKAGLFLTSTGEAAPAPQRGDRRRARMR